MVHRREINGEPIVLGNYGALFGNAMTWFDHETGSIWSQPRGEAIMGPLAGERLELLPSTLTTWGDWTETHPESLALAAPGDFSGFSLDQLAIVVELGPVSVAHPVLDIRRAGVANSTVGDVPVAVTVVPGSDNWVVLSRQLDDRLIELRVDLDGDDGPALAEIDGPGRWDMATGLGIDGTGENLDRLPGFTSFPNDYTTFFPEGAFWQPDGLVTVAEVLGS